MRRNHIRRFCCMALALSLAVASCGRFGASPGDAEKGSGNTATDNMAGNDSRYSVNGGYGRILAGLGVEIPVSRPGIYVAQAGYVPDREKKVVFVGDRHGETFDVVRIRDGAVVYTGSISDAARDALSGPAFSTGDFTDFGEAGTYYICTDIVGQSYPFSIAEDTYENLFLNILRNISDIGMQESPEGVCDVSFGMHVIMHALQCNGALFEAAYEHPDANGQDRQPVTRLLYLADRLLSVQGNDGSVYGDYGATAAFCGIMTMSRGSFGRYAAGIDSGYRLAAQKAWSWIEKQECDTDAGKSARFYAAAQLFKAYGNEEYREIAEGFLRERNEAYSGERFVFYGVLAYLSAETGTDRDLCTHIMMDMTERVKNICSEAGEDAFFGTGARTIERNMSDMLHLSFVNYLTPSREYTAVIENTIQYAGGFNENGICYMGADGFRPDMQETAGRSFEWNGIMLLAVSDLLKNIREQESD